MTLDEAAWRRLRDALPPPDDPVAEPLAVAFLAAEDFARRRGTARLWWPGGAPAPDAVAFDGRYPEDWGLLLVMDATAIAKVGAGGTACMASLVRQLAIKPFVLRQRDDLEAAGVLDFIDTLELATPKH